MKIFELLELDSGEGRVQTLKVTEEEKVWWVMPDSTSPRWQEYLRYTEWVEAGNNPEEFWTRLEAGDN